ncbi:hypothetical protein [Neorickettsia findlayensis]|uniref:Transmembrane protein n=1 Tax=Neorickettsia findlayensis TaxID=2686014 RepID=A0A6P1G9F0_9RICK|nr:hypothetical protein [Neorickettsia findlayensis]QHD64918.1 hypothetical protein GP480_00300 [Neorickettsia findlayensis]
MERDMQKHKRTAIVSLFFFLLSSVTILAVQMAIRIPWKPDWRITKSWWCFLYLSVPAIVWCGSLCGVISVLISDVHEKRATSDVADAIRKYLGISSLLLIAVLPLVLIPLGAVLDHKKNLSLTQTQVLAGIECALLGLFFLAFSSLVVICLLSGLSYKTNSFQINVRAPSTLGVEPAASPPAALTERAIDNRRS